MINAAWVDTEDGAQISVRHYVNLGIAAATPRACSCRTSRTRSR